MKWNSRHPPVRVSVLAVRTTLADLSESEIGKDRSDLTRLEDGHIAHGLGDLHGLGAHELAFEFWIAVFEQHGDHLREVLA